MATVLPLSALPASLSQAHVGGAGGWGPQRFCLAARPQALLEMLGRLVGHVHAPQAAQVPAFVNIHLPAGASSPSQMPGRTVALNPACVAREVCAVSRKPTAVRHGGD